MRQFNNEVMKNQKKLLATAILIILGILFRTVWHLGPNVEFITAGTLLAGIYLGLKYAIIVPLLTLGFTDLFLGNTNIFLFTWSGYIVIGYLSHLSHLSDLGRTTKILGATSLGIIAGLCFYLWTNFGVWLLDSFGMYPKTLSGLFQAYIMGLPFLEYNLLGNILFIPSSFFFVEFAKTLKAAKFWSIKTENYP
jgi:uncharacterized membrane protein